MAFTGTPVVKLVADGLVRISGTWSLDQSASGTIGLFEKSTPAEITLPEAFKPRKYDLPDAAPPLSLQASIQVELGYAGTGTVINPIKVVKTGTTPEDFAITLTNTSNSEVGDSGDIELYVRFH